MFGSGDFWDENFEITLLLLEQFQNFENRFGQFIPNQPPKHVITRIKRILLWLILRF